MIRNAILRGIATTPTELKTSTEIALERRAIGAISEYRLVKDGVASYRDLGYGVSGVKLLEYLAIDAEFAEAMADKL